MDGTQKSKIYFTINCWSAYFKSFRIRRLGIKRFVYFIHVVILHKVTLISNLKTIYYHVLLPNLTDLRRNKATE